MMRSASSLVKGSTSFFETLGFSRGAIGFFLISPSFTAESRIVDSLNIAFRFTPGDDHSMLLMIRRKRVGVI